MKDGDEFDRLHDEYLAFLDEGAGDYLQEHAEIMQDSLGLDSADTVPVVGINPLTAEPYIMTLAMVGYKEINGEMYQCSLAWYPFPKLPIEVLHLLHKKENTRMADDGDDEDLVAELLRRRLAIVALIEDTDDADAVGWRQVLKEVQTGQRNTNFEDAMGADEIMGDFGEQLTGMLGDLLSGSMDDMTFGDLVRMIADAQEFDKRVEPVVAKADEDFTEWDDTFVSDWE